MKIQAAVDLPKSVSESHAYMDGTSYLSKVVIELEISDCGSKADFGKEDCCVALAQGGLEGGFISPVRVL